MKVQIYDQTHNVAGDLDPVYVEQLAQHVDTTMRQIARATGTIDSSKVALYAALAIADELFTLRQSREDSRQSLRDQAQRCLNLVERALEQNP